MKYFVHVIRLLFLGLFIYLLITGKTMFWLALFGVSLIIAPIFGRLYCGYVCPMNTLMIPTEWISKKLKLQTLKEPKWLKKGYFGWIALVLSIASMILAKRFLHINLPILPFWVIIAVLVTLRYKPAVFHNLICPFGVLQRLFGRSAWLSKRIDKNACIGCKLCEKTCPSNSIGVYPDDNKAKINTSLCHQCTNCQQACPKNAIYYGKKRKLD